MQGGQLLVVIIDTPDSNRSQPLIRSLGSDSRFNVVRLPACMLNAYSDVDAKNIEVNLETFQFFQGREMSPQEIGCATSHNRARHLLANSLIGGVVLEDDARITDVDSFYTTAIKFLKNQSGALSILSMNEFRASSSLAFNKEGSQRLLGTPFLAVSYAATPIAAETLCTANEPIRTVSDWPRTRIKYFSLYKPLILHEGNNGLSTIDVARELNRRGLTITKKLAQFSFIPFFVSKPINTSLDTYIFEVYWSRVTWHIDSLIRRFLKGVYR